MPLNSYLWIHKDAKLSDHRNLRWPIGSATRDSLEALPHRQPGCERNKALSLFFYATGMKNYRMGIVAADGNPAFLAVTYC